MSQSQASESQYEASQFAESFIDPDLLQSDDFLELPSSEITRPSISISDIYPPSREKKPHAPTSLERIGKPFQRFYILYPSDDQDTQMEASRRQFVHWWLDTEYGLKPELRKSIRWASELKKSDAWLSFDQVAHERTGEPKVMCKRCQNVIVHPGHRRAGLSPMRAHLSSSVCTKPQPLKKQGIDQLIRNSPQRLRSQGFSQVLLLKRLLQFITTARLPFRIVERPEFKELVEIIQRSEDPIDIPSPRTIRRLLDTTIHEQQHGVLSKLPEGSRLSIALDCWTSPFRQAFMAITGYFLDQDWNYCEVLLGFEPLHGSHTGENLSKTVLQLLQDHDITDHVLSVTTDNATSNDSMMESIQEVIQSQTLTDTSIFRIPCISHVIQLSLNELLGKLKATPANKEAESEWSDERTQSLQSKRPTMQIVDTLKKIRELAVFVNASPQRREAFLALQTKEPRLIPIQDVRTRWNSTFLMLNRAKKLQPVFDEYCTTHQYLHFKLDQEEWRQIEYLLLLTKPFFDFTNVLSKSRDVTVHHVFSIYNRLFNHLDDAEKKLKRKGVPWKKRMLQALAAAKKKLNKYYSATDDEPYGIVYAIATILCPSKKLRYFNNKDWRGENENGEKVDFMKTYWDALQKEFERYRQDVLKLAEPTDAQASKETAEEEELAMLCDSQTPLLPDVDQPDDEITRYLAKGLTKGNPRLYWKEHEHGFPVLARIARDILSIPASGAGVERLFNCARDICHYRRGHLKPDTIKGLMLHLFSSKFELEHSQLEIVKEYLSAGEAAMFDQARAPLPPLQNLDPISDDEEEGCEQEDESDDDTEDDAEDGVEDTLSLTQATTQNKQAKRKRSQLRKSEALDDAELPIEESTQARSGRIRKKPRLPDGFEIDKL